jgi:HAD superfamily hydrolase (TIGR01458 family)
VITDSGGLDSEAATLRRAVAGTRALLLDLDGVVVLRKELIRGAAGALVRLDAAAIPYAIATNTSLVGRATLARDLARAGLPIPPERIVSASSVAAAVCRSRFAGQPLYVLAAPDALTEFAGQRLLSHADAATTGARAAAVVVGDAADDFTPRNLQSAFTLVRNGARLLAMHKNRWWFTPQGVTLDSGAYVAALEFATERRALVTGKPSRPFFMVGLDILSRASAGGSAPLASRDVAMVGDDLWNDVRGAQRAGLRGFFVRSGKHGDAELTRFSAGRGGGRPDAVAPSIAEIIDALVGSGSI